MGLKNNILRIDMENTLLPIRIIFNTLNNFKWYEVVYVPKAKLSLESKCIVHDPDDVDDEESDEPKVVSDNNLVYGLDIKGIQEIILNLKQQGVSEVTDKVLLDAFTYYLKNDAFIEIKK
jgi:hypothetical protein